MAKILVADDNSNIQKMVGLALKDQGIDVVAVGNGEAAVRKIPDVKPDLVLADVFMPVRNGYEVCRFVKEDPATAHIPVILLVGAFDPLDEQEAQRVGADGVLKKPFVPPDPLISMVKSALSRAGVSIGQAAPEKAPEPAVAARKASELLTPAVSSKLAELSPAAIPEAEAEPVPEDFSTAHPPDFKIAAGQEPVAFGNLMETPSVEDEAAFTTKPAHIDDHKWGASDDETDVPEEEDEGSSGWRPSAITEEVEERAAKTGTHDWREAAFHGASPARSTTSGGWNPGVEETHFAAAAEAASIAVTTLEPKPAEVAPFSSDAWSASIAAGIEERFSRKSASPEDTVEIPVAQPPAEEAGSVHETDLQELAPVEHSSVAAPEVTPEVAQQTAPAEEPKAHQDWLSVSSSPWDSEAKKASLLASTWDSPAPEVPVVSLEPEHVEAAPVLDQAEEQVEASVVEHAEIHETKSWENAWESAPASTSEATAEPASFPADSFPAPASEPVLSTTTEPEPVVTAEAPEFQSAESVADALALLHSEPDIAAPVEAPAEFATPAQENAPKALGSDEMDALVARVLSKMNPDVLQAVTRELLKPVVQAIIHDELNKKS